MMMHPFFIPSVDKAMGIGCQNECQLNLPPVDSHTTSTKEKEFITTTTDQVIHCFGSQFSKVQKSKACLLLGLL